jgi:CRISPR-associated protein Cas1
MDLFDAVSHFEALWLGWQKVLANNGAMGGDGVTVRAFATYAHNSVSRLSHSLRTGSYRVQPFREVDIPRKGGGVRRLTIPSVVDRIAQASTALVLGLILDREMEPSSFAYRPGRSVSHAIARISQLRRDGYRYVVDGDIVRYFDNIPHEPLISLLDRHVPSTRLVDLIALWLDSFAPEGRGVPQGSPLSPLLANLYLDRVDEEIEGRGIRLVRYADDFVILCKEEHAAHGALARMAKLLAEAGLSLHPEKTAIRSFDQGFRFLGHVMVRSMVYKEVEYDETPSEDVVGSAERLLAGASEGGRLPAAPDVASEPEGRWAVRRRVLYVLEPGRVLDADGEHIVVADEGGPVLELPAALVDRVEVGSDVEIRMQALDLISSRGTELVRINGYGVPVGRWEAPHSGRAERHLAQAALILDPQRRAVLAQAFVAGRIGNQRTLLKRLDRGRNDPELQPVFVRLGRLLRRMEKATGTAEEAMGREGEAAALYWPMLGRLLQLPWAFSGSRRRRVGHDPFNVVVDVLASLLCRECRSALLRTGLHPGFPALHAAQDHEDPLAWDLSEEFRAPLVEAVAFGLFKRRALREESFVHGANGVRLTPSGWAAAIRGFEGMLARPVRDPVEGTTQLWRGMIDLQARRLVKAVEGAQPYRAYRMDY